MRRAFIAAPSLRRLSSLLCDDEQTRGIAVEPVHQAGAQRVAGQRTFDVREQRVDERAALWRRAPDA